MAKILNFEEPFSGCRSYNGRNYVKGDYDGKIKLFPIVTSEGTFNLDRAEVIALLVNLGLIGVKRVTAAVLQKLVGTDIDVSKIKDK
ncbi:MAG: hypothetical protein HDR38_05625 [Treponema sp.]|nr:hypothetical protein [Treponema sp.]